MKSTSMQKWFLCLSTGLLAAVMGCGETTPEKKVTPKTADAHDHDHDHEEGHDHGDKEKGKDDHASDHPEHGPNGGHVAKLSGDEYNIEWAHDDEAGLVTIYLLDKDLKNVAESDAKELLIETKVGDKTESYTLPLVPSESETAKSTRFELADKTLLTSLLMTEGVTNTVKVTVGGKELQANIKHDASHEH